MIWQSTRQILSIIVLIALFIVFILKINSGYQDKTSLYINHLSVENIERKGSDYTNFHYDPYRIGKGPNELDITYDYDFKLLNEVTVKLEGVNRKRVLQKIFQVVTEGSETNNQKHLKVLYFLQRASFHNNLIQPMYKDRSTVFDPLVLLELNEMRCGHVARIAADLFDAAGYPARIVQLGQHVAAEIFYDHDWHYFDADIFGGGEVVKNARGYIPSFFELSKDPFQIDSLSHYQELDYRGKSYNYGYYPSFFYFSKKAYKGYGFKYYVKTATKAQAQLSKYYGWDFYKTIQVDSNSILSDFNLLYQPGAVRFTKIKEKGNAFTISWDPSNDRDGDLIGYRIFIGKVSRGWHYEIFSGAPELKSYWRGGWKPEMYDALFQLPPKDAGFFETTDTTITIQVPLGEVRYLTVMPFDKHGELVGKKLYFRSEELVLDRR